jgi:hypothetical protein
MKTLGWLASALIFALSGCAASSARNVAVPAANPLGTFKTVAINVDSSVPDSSEEAKQLNKFIVAAFWQKGRWQVTDPPAEVQLNATITELSRVGSGTRLLLGALAGQASVKVDVELKDTTGKILGKFTASGKSSGGTVFAGTTDQALEEAAKEIVGFFASS